MHNHTSPHSEEALKSTTVLVSNTSSDDHLLHEEKAAQFLGLSPRTLQQWRYSGYGPPHIRLSRRAIRYRMRDLLDFVASLKYQNTIQHSEGARS